jgi:hypothetical protein
MNATPLENWEQLHPSLVAIKIRGEEPCFLDCLSMAKHTSYRTETEDGKPYDRRHHVVSLRKEIASSLTDKDPLTKATIYNTLAGGRLASYAQRDSNYTLENMKYCIENHETIDNIYLELYSNLLKVDVFILDDEKADIFRPDNPKLLYKSRESIVLIYRRGHYDLVGIDRGDHVVSFFRPDNLLIRTLRGMLSL